MLNCNINTYIYPTKGIKNVITKSTHNSTTTFFYLKLFTLKEIIRFNLNMIINIMMDFQNVYYLYAK